VCSEAFEKHIQELIGFSNQPLIAIGHNFYYEGSYSDYSGKELLPRIESFAGCDLVAMGHLHQFRPMRKQNPIAVYTGSMEKTNFADADVDKFILDYESNTKDLKIVKLPVRQLLDGEIDASKCDTAGLQDFVMEELEKLDVKDKVVRVSISVKENLAIQLKKREVESYLYSKGAFYISKINIKPTKEKTVKDLSILSLKNDSDIFKAFVEQQSLEEELKKSIIEQIQNIF
jgi:DNA repair exonuclease SbcCD nuclease subunit